TPSATAGPARRTPAQWRRPGPAARRIPAAPTCVGSWRCARAASCEPGVETLRQRGLSRTRVQPPMGLWSNGDPGDGRLRVVAMRASPGRIPFRVAIVAVVVGLLVVTCGVLLGYGLSADARNIKTLKGEYLDQVADTSLREVARLPQTAAQVLKVQRYRIETGFYRLSDPMSVARGLAAALETDPDILWVSYSETATGQFIGARRNKADEYVLNLSDPRVNGGVPREY